ncbi:Wzz/FepE/Etk N-terminal domain-containing protein [Billgrantia gudaonensis]|uniref:LPS O-antigen chain length determinant protein, WzzB/FepE family n=1 Tax=Billgrantia gudaonensis TaxID=376427 RepID=A0A1G8P9Y7_9GAMM|nr:Wzz/FepE/Etk N-terminal domain-containing protein [Halomonas gudaonensis]SDI89333.1 LPS O-antigen chain length determinant protein, WzzB/FepE family [Halomonas gudaonensis]
MNAYSEYPDATTDEIDLRDIAIALVEGWRWIAGAVVAGVALALIHLFMTTPTYSSELKISPFPDGLREINAIEGYSYSEERAFDEFVQRVSSYQHFQRFIEGFDRPASEWGLPADGEPGDADFDAALRRFFDARFSVGRLDEGSAVLQLSYPRGVQGHELLNAYVSWANSDFASVLANRAQRALDSAISRNEARMEAHLTAYEGEVSARIARLSEDDEIRLENLRDRLEAEKRAVVAAREERIRLLTQAEHIAEQLGIERPTTPRDLGRQSGERDIVYAEINSQEGLPLYFMGTRALQAERRVIEENLDQEAKTSAIREIEKEIAQLETNHEIQAMLARKSHSPFIDAYNALKQDNALLRANVIRLEDIRVADVTQWAYAPEAPDSPRTQLVVVLALVLGGMVGILLVFIANFVKSLRAYRRQRILT